MKNLNNYEIDIEDDLGVLKRDGINHASFVTPTAGIESDPIWLSEKTNYSLTSHNHNGVYALSGSCYLSGSVVADSDKLDGQHGSYYQPLLNGSGYVKCSGSSVSYENKTYYLSGSKVSDSDLWDSYQFSDYLNQAVLTTSSPAFLGLSINVVTPVFPPFEISGAAGYTQIGCSCYSETTYHNPALNFFRSHSNTNGTKVETVDTEILGQLLATGVNSSSALASPCGIKLNQDGAAGATYIPGSITFQTGTNAAARTDRMKIDNAGDVTIGTTSTNKLTITARFIPRTTASNPQHATPASRPAGTIGELVNYGSKMYFCTNAATPTWEKITSA